MVFYPSMSWGKNRRINRCTTRYGLANEFGSEQSDDDSLLGSTMGRLYVAIPKHPYLDRSLYAGCSRY
jgi:hypothetical protein